MRMNSDNPDFFRFQCRTTKVLKFSTIFNSNNSILSLNFIYLGKTTNYSSVIIMVINPMIWVLKKKDRRKMLRIKPNDILEHFR